MRKLIENNDEFEKLKKYVVAKGDNYNSDRCISVPIKVDNETYEATVCLNEETKTIAICEVLNDASERVENDIDKEILIELTNNSKVFRSTKKEDEEYEFYSRNIECNTKCCQYNCVECFKDI